MNTNKLEILISSKINEAVNGLVDLNSADAAQYRYLQGIIHGLKTASSIIREFDAKERDEDV